MGWDINNHALVTLKLFHCWNNFWEVKKTGVQGCMPSYIGKCTQTPLKPPGAPQRRSLIRYRQRARRCWKFLLNRHLSKSNHFDAKLCWVDVFAYCILHCILLHRVRSPHPAILPRSWWCKFAGRREAVKRTWDNQTGGRSAERWKLNLSRGSLSLHSDVFVSDVLRAISERIENLTTNTSSSLPLSISWLSPIVIYLSISLGISGAPFEILWQF